MATIGDGWTVIGPSQTVRKPEHETIPLGINDFKGEEVTDGDISPQHQKDDEASFVPPVATWFDEVHFHFVALQDTELSEIVVKDDNTSRRNSFPKSYNGSDHTNSSTKKRNFWKQWNKNTPSNSSMSHFDDIDKKDDSENDQSKCEFLIYQRLRVPCKSSRYPLSNSDEMSESLVADPPLRVALPIQLTQKKKKVSVKNNDRNEKEEDYITDITTTYTKVRRNPILAKFSINQKYLVIQFSTTSVRIVPTTRPTTDTKQEKQKHDQQHWTIDLMMDAGTACSSRPHEMPEFFSETAACDPSSKNKRNRLFGKNSLKSDESIKPGTTSLLPGGVLWCPGNKKKQQEHQKNAVEGQEVIQKSNQHHDNDEELLLLITNTGLIIYKVSLTNHRFTVSKYESIPFHLTNPTSNTKSSLSPAVAFWHEPRGGALLVGSYNNKISKAENPIDSSVPETKTSSMQIRTFFFQPLVDEKNTTKNPLPISASDVITYKQPYSFIFEVGIRTNVGSHLQLIPPEHLAIVNVYDKIYFVELNTKLNFVNLYSLGPNCSTHMVQYKPDGLYMEPQNDTSFFISVLDNLIVIILKESKKSLYIDVAEPTADCLLVDDSQCFEEGKVEIRKLYDSTYTFLAPSFLLNPKGRGFVSQIEMNSQKLSDRFPWSKKNLTLFFLRRRDSGLDTVHLILLKRIRNYFENKDKISSEIVEFIDQFGVMYANNADAITWDQQACLPFIYKAALLPATIKKIDQDGTSNNYLEDANSGVQSTLTQSEILGHILLPISYSAVINSDFAKLRIMLNFSISFVGALQQKSLEACDAIYCLIIALCWRLGDGADIIGFLRSFKYHRQFISKKVPTSTCDDDDHAQQIELRKVMLQAFAEMLIMIVTTVPFGETLKDVNLDVNSSLHNSLRDNEDDIPEEEQKIRDSVLAYAVDILCSISSHRVAARFLLKIGKVTDAISICAKVMYDETVLYHRSKGNVVHDKHLKFVDQGTSSVDFFKATVYASSNMKGLGERARLFYHLNKFLRRWDPESFEAKNDSAQPIRNSLFVDKTDINAEKLPKSKSEGAIMKSDNTLLSSSTCPISLAKSLGSFPDHLLGGADNPICEEVRMMYGFSTK